jgi:NADH dehydrogenase
MTKVIIIGAGFGGINAAKGLYHKEIELLVIDKTNHHLFQPLLYQVAGAMLSPGDIAAPVREILRKQQNTTCIMADVIGIDKEKREVTTSDGKAYPFDYLIVATGARHSYFGHPEWEAFAPGLKDLEDAVKIREKILLAFEEAEKCEDPIQVKEYLRFVIIGGGPTGVEMAGSIAEIAHRALFKNFRHIQPEHSEVILLEGADRLLTQYPPFLSEIAKKDLEKLGVVVRTKALVTNITQEGVYLGQELIRTQNIVWGAGNQASPLLKTLQSEQDRAGRVLVEPDLSLPGFPNIFVIGDAAALKDEEGNLLPGIAPVAIQMGRYVAKVIGDKISNGSRKPFHYWDKGSLATIGRSKAVGKVGGREVWGFFAWFLWGVVHIFYLISFRNRFFVMLDWIFSYISGERQVRLIKKPLK